MYKTSPSISESELSSSKIKHLFIAATHNIDPTFKPDYYHHFTTLPSCFLTESYPHLRNIKEQMTAQKVLLVYGI